MASDERELRGFTTSFLEGEIPLLRTAVGVAIRRKNKVANDLILSAEANPFNEAAVLAAARLLNAATLEVKEAEAELELFQKILRDREEEAAKLSPEFLKVA